MLDKRFTIRLLNRVDIPQVLKIERDIFPDPWEEEMFYEEISTKKSYVLEDVKKGIIVGYLCGFSVLDEYSILNIAITGKYQHKGLGRTLLEFAVMKAIKDGCFICWLEVRKSNNAAIGFYQKIGFKIVGTRKGYYQTPPEDAYVMRLDLQEL